jgi:hypothetical protein
MLSKGPTLFRSFITSAFAIALLAGLPITGFARPAPAPTATPSPPPEDASITQIARREFVSWQAGVVDLNHYANATQAKLLPNKIADTSKALGALGSLIKTEWVGPAGLADAPPTVKGYVYRMVCTNASVYEILTVENGKIDGIVFRDKLTP